MIVDRRLLHGALIRVLRAVSADDSALVHDEDVDREWRRMTGLRRADLDCAVHDMIDRGQLCVHRAPGTARDYELTSGGRGELLWRGAMLSLGDWFVLSGARARALLALLHRRHPEGPASDRRHGHGAATG